MNRKGYSLLFIFVLLLCVTTGCKKEHVHEWDEGVIVEHASCESDGLKKFTCKDCGETKEELIPSGLHIWTNATCEVAKTCTVCHTTDGSALGHSWQAATISTPKKCETCGKTEGSDLITEALKLAVPSTTQTKLELPTTVLEYPVVWKSMDKGVMLDDGTIVYNDITREAILQVEINLGEEKITREVKVQVYTPSINPLEYKYAYSLFSAIFDKTLYTDAKLLTKKQSGFKPIYESTDESVITSNGVITKALTVQTAIMNIYVVKNGVAVMYPTEVTVSDFTNMERIELAKAALEKTIADFQAGKINSLPFYDEVHDVKLSWVSNNPELMVMEDHILLPVDKVDVRLRCTLSRDTDPTDDEEGDSDTCIFSLTNIGGNSIDAYLNEFLTTIMPTKIIGHKNIVYDQYGTGELYLKSQYAVNTGAVLNLIDGKDLFINKDYYVDTSKGGIVKENYDSVYHPAIATDPTTSTNLQAVYEHFWEGYTIPNKENILWIVVHESGMPIEGQDAVLLATIQYENAYGLGRTTSASWHYQVDENGIYQSFDDRVYAWHAGGDYGKWLPYRNSNSIGIEMCINQDGNYDGSMAHDAKLVAELMHRYNLTMDNVVRHHDTSGKECPSYMIRTNRYEEFLAKVCNEYVAMKYLKDAEVTWTISNPDLFIKGPNGLYYSKAVVSPTEVQITLNVVKGSYTFNKTITLTLYPDGTTGA